MHEQTLMVGVMFTTVFAHRHVSFALIHRTPCTWDYSPSVSCYTVSSPQADVFMVAMVTLFGISKLTRVVVVTIILIVAEAIVVIKTQPKHQVFATG